MDFSGESPDRIKRGQNVQIRLALSDETRGAILIPRGGFYSSNGGNYVYVLSEEVQLPINEVSASIGSRTDVKS